MRDRAGLVVRLTVCVAVFGFVLGHLGCIASRVSDLEAYQKIPMDRVVPFPLEAELRKRAFEIVVVVRPSEGIDDTMLEVPRAQLRRGLEKIATDAGAVIIDRWDQSLADSSTEPVPSEVEALSAEAVGRADYALATRFSTYRHTSTWKKPFKFLWQSSEDVAARRGTCHHLVDVEFDLRVIEVGTNDRVEQTFVLSHTVEQRNKDLDSACTIAPVTLTVLFETALDEALSCLQMPLGRLLSPRGHISAHRKAREAERHIFRVSLGSAQGIEEGDTVEIRREQRAMSPSGEISRSERVISLGRVTDQISAEMSWIAIDLAKATDDILEGDVVRPIEHESLLASLSGPNCGSILELR